MSGLKSAVRQMVWGQMGPMMGVILGLGLGAFVVVQIEALEPHRTLMSNAADRVYVSKDCAFSAQALDFLTSEPGTRRVAVIPLDSMPTADRHEMCRSALEILRHEGSILWRVLPDDYACTRLAANARAWLSEAHGYPLEIPLWVVGEAALSGTSEETIAYLRAEGLLANPL